MLVRLLYVSRAVEKDSAKAIESILANERGRRICEGLNVGLPEGNEASEAQRWGLDVEKLREHIKEKTPVSWYGIAWPATNAHGIHL